MPNERVPHLAEAHLVELSKSICLCRTLIMARFASQAELDTFLSRLDLEYSQFASSLWQNGVRTARQLANASKPLLLSWGLPELYIDDIKATADRTGELKTLIACTVCLIYHQAILHVVCLCA